MALTAPESTACVGCGRSFAVTPERSTLLTDGSSFIGQYFSDLALLMTRPTRFFTRLRESERDNSRDGVVTALAFAVVTHWIGQSLKFFWQAGLSGTISDRLMPAFKFLGDVADVDHPGQSAALHQTRERFIHWMWGAGSVIADPFITLVQILFTSFLVFIGARILINPGRGGAPAEVRYETSLKIVCYGMTPAILAAIPFAGPLIASICICIVTTIGVREIYRTGWGRAAVVALFPKLLFLAIAGFGLFLIGILFFKLVASVI